MSQAAADLGVLVLERAEARDDQAEGAQVHRGELMERGVADGARGAMSKPSPVQARVLRLLAKWPGTRLHRERTGCVPEHPQGVWPDEGWQGAYDQFRADVRALDTGLVGKARTPTALAMERAGWLRRDPNDPWVRTHPRFEITEAGQLVVGGLVPTDFLDRLRRKAEPIVSAAVMLDAIEARWNREGGWVWFREWHPGNGKGQEWRRLDAAAINQFWSEGYERMAFEIKRSRGDFLGELAHPEKRAPALRFSNRFWFVTPEGLVDPDEVPAEAGLVWVARDGAVQVKRRAPRREAEPISDGLFGAALRYLEDQIARGGVT